MKVKKIFLGECRYFFRHWGYDLVRLGESSPRLSFIPFKKTLLDAKKLNMRPSDYIDVIYNIPGATQQAIDNMERAGISQKHFHRICEIGPGSGRFLEKIKEKGNGTGN